jgi:hypothetical protein
MARVIHIALLGLVSLVSAVGRETESLPSILSRAPYVQCATATSIWVLWRTTRPIQPVVRYGLSPQQLSSRVERSAIVVRLAPTTNRADLELTNRWAGLTLGPRLHSAPAGTVQYEAHLTGLRPATTYYYAVCDGDQPLTAPDPSYHFRTHPLPGTLVPIRFGAFGDSGTGRERQRRVWEALLEFTARDRHPMDFFLHLGDMAYNRGRDVEFSTRFFGPYEATLRHTVFWPTFANHEGITSKGAAGLGPYFDAYRCPTNGEAGGAPSGHEGFYSFDYGPAHFISLNSHDEDRRPTSRMAQWLKRDLAQTRAQWLIAFFHQAPYSKGSHDSDREKEMIQMRTYIVPILEAAGVDLVLAGHSHIYERSMLVDGAYATPTIAENAVLDDGDGDPRGDGPYRKPAGRLPNAGTVYVVAGHGGATMRRKATCPLMRKTILEHGSLLVDIQGDTLTGYMIDHYGDVRDTFSIVKRDGVTPMRLAYPWVPPAWIAAKAPATMDELGTSPPDSYLELIPRNATWQYLAGTHPRSDAWTRLGFDGRDWQVGEAPFGYGPPDVQFGTVLADMPGRYTTVYLRREFDVEAADAVTELGLLIAYADGFIAYLNGHEVLRRGVGQDRGRSARDITPRRAQDRTAVRYYPLRDAERYLRTGRNVLAIEGHVANLNSPACLLDPALISED